MEEPARNENDRKRDAALVIADGPVATMIGSLCRDRGYKVSRAMTPLDAVHALVKLGHHIGVIVMMVGAPWYEEFRELVADEFPEIDQIITIS